MGTQISEATGLPPPLVVFPISIYAPNHSTLLTSVTLACLNVMIQFSVVTDIRSPYPH